MLLLQHRLNEGWGGQHLVFTERINECLAKKQKDIDRL